MSGPISRPPLGLLGMFDVRGAGGLYPSALADFVQPTIDLAAFYGSVPTERVTSSLNVNSNGAFPWIQGLAVPNNERWFLLDVSWIVNLATDQAGTLTPILYRADEVADVPIPLGPEFGRAAPGGAATMSFASAATYQMPRVIGPGMAFSVLVRDFVGGAAGSYPPSISAWILRLTA